MSVVSAFDENIDYDSSFEVVEDEHLKSESFQFVITKGGETNTINIESAEVCFKYFFKFQVSSQKKITMPTPEAWFRTNFDHFSFRTPPQFSLPLSANGNQFLRITSKTTSKGTI
ncbi:hypothetical protein B9Z55_006386 [Caenorhabditis nigoni]|uniref:Uncharacterized protein n=1 Tax=Caenorhabditis nigoni TaxID=1611254 RepID=A0A2G5V4U1_9PELO|nr:hypothetical protein B9Z55_006386 [Caenorhabditis nigoni]